MVGNNLIAVHSRSSNYDSRSLAGGPEGLERFAGEEAEKARIERLGRERPQQFKSTWAEIGFVYSILASELMAVCNERARASSTKSVFWLTDMPDRNIS